MRLMTLFVLALSLAAALSCGGGKRKAPTPAMPLVTDDRGGVTTPAGITLEDLNSCARNPHKRVMKPMVLPPGPERPKQVRVDDLESGQGGWIRNIYSYRGRLLVNGTLDVFNQRDSEWAYTLIRRDPGGIVVSCTPSPEVVIWDADPEFHPDIFTPIVGMFNPAKEKP